MMQEDDLRALGKIVDFFRAVAVTLLILHCYWYCYEAFYKLGLYNDILNSIIQEVAKTGLFQNYTLNKIYCVAMLGLSCLGTQGVKSEKMTWFMISFALFFGGILFFFNFPLLKITNNIESNALLYIISLVSGFILLLTAGNWISRLLNNDLMKDVFNEENESFLQEERLLNSEYSVNLRTKYQYRKKEHRGWINVVNPFRATTVLGTPGSGKTFAIINQFIKQQIEKGFAMYVYDFKQPDLTEVAYNHLLNNQEGYKIKPKFYIINFDDPSKSHRCNPINASFMSDISDAYESAYTIMLNLNKTWIQKQGDFFVESPIILFAAIIWFLRIYKEGKYCTFPHAIEFLNKPYEQIFPILTSYRELENYLSPFMDAWKGGAADQLMVRP